jgi:hypothetical protein
MSLILLLTDRAADLGGYMISIVSIVVVFVSMAILIFIFQSIPRLLHLNIRKRLKKAGIVAADEKPKVALDVNVHAAIAMGLHLYFEEQHDEESRVITIHNAPKQYSPWSSKIYGVLNQPVKK